MTSFEFRNGYSRVPTADPEAVEGCGATGGYGGVQHGPHRDWDAAGTSGRKKSKKKGSTPNLKPGLFHMFGDRWRYAANHMSTAVASQSESEQEAERIELTEIRPKRPKLRRGRVKSTSRSPKNRTKQKFRFNVIEEPVLPGDTVQRVALRYNCPSAEIRRVNHLYRDQDFHALKVVKIPIREHGILSDPKAREKCRKNNMEEIYHSSGGATSDDLRLGGPTAYYRSDDDDCQRSCDDADDEVGDSDSPEVRDVSIHSALKWKHSQKALLDKFDEDLQRVRENTEQRLANLNEVALTMTTPAIQPISLRKNTYEKSLLMANFDWLTVNFDWRVVTIVGSVCVALLIVCITVYVIYIKKTQTP